MPESPISAPNPSIAADLKSLLQASGGRAMRVEEILHHTRGRGLQVIAIVLCLPFLSPVSLPVISIPFGVAIAVCGLRIALRHDPWLPAFAKNRSIPFPVLEKMLNFGIAAHARIARFLRVRWTVLLDSHAATMADGLAISLSAFFLSLPIPPPFPLTNTIPACAIIFLCLGMLERDGVFVFAGYVLTFVAAVYVGLIAFAGTAGAGQVWKWISGAF